MKLYSVTLLWNGISASIVRTGAVLAHDEEEAVSEMKRRFDVRDDKITFIAVLPFEGKSLKPVVVAQLNDTMSRWVNE